jgi:succinate-acetate transporter protein
MSSTPDPTVQQERRFQRETAARDEASARWEDRTRVVLQPIAPPSVLGLFGFAGATFIVAAQLAGWYGNASSPQFLFPFAAIFGGLAQFIAGMWAYRARDAVATAMHGMWGSFWMAYGILFLLVAVGALTVPSGKFSELGFWFLALSAITIFGTMAALADNLALVAVLGTLAVGAALLAVHYLTGISTWGKAGGWVLIASAILATYTAAAMMMESSFGRVVLPLGKMMRDANIPGRRVTTPIERASGEPGVRRGQ